MANPIYRIPSSLFIDTSNDKVTIEKDAIAVASSVGLSLLNNSAGTSGNPQNSSGIEFIGAGYTGSISATNKFMIQTQSVSGAYTPTGNNGDGYLSISSLYNSGTYTNIFTIDSSSNIKNSGFIAYTGPTANVVTPNPFILPTLLNSYVTPASGLSTFATIGYWKDGAGVVHLKGNAGGGTAGAAVFNLPAGYRPGTTGHFIGIRDNALFYVIINSSGDCSAGSGGNTHVFFDGIHFFAEA